jgi:P27 family predicted phage terminase small subunit
MAGKDASSADELADSVARRTGAQDAAAGEAKTGRPPISLHERAPAARLSTAQHISPNAKAEVGRISSQSDVLGIITELDRAALAAYCQAYGRWVEAERKLKETPMLLKLPSGIIQQSPWLAISNKQLELMLKYSSELGLSPVSRSRVEARPPATRSKFEGLLGQLEHWR